MNFSATLNPIPLLYPQSHQPVHPVMPVPLSQRDNVEEDALGMAR